MYNDFLSLYFYYLFSIYESNSGCRSLSSTMTYSNSENTTAAAAVEGETETMMTAGNNSSNFLVGKGNSHNLPIQNNAAIGNRGRNTVSSSSSSSTSCVFSFVKFSTQYNMYNV